MKFSEIKEAFQVSFKDGFEKYGKMLLSAGTSPKKLLLILGAIVVPGIFSIIEFIKTLKRLKAKPKTLLEQALANDEKLQNANPDMKTAYEETIESMTKNIIGTKEYKKSKKNKMINDLSIYSTSDTKHYRDNDRNDFNHGELPRNEAEKREFAAYLKSITDGVKNRNKKKIRMSSCFDNLAF